MVKSLIAGADETADGVPAPAIVTEVWVLHTLINLWHSTTHAAVLLWWGRKTETSAEKVLAFSEVNF